MRAYRYDGYVARISSMKSYFDENMKMLDDANVSALFSGRNPIYTKIRDDHPARYINGSKAANIMAADGCVVEGEVENSILFRGVYVGKGAKIKNSIVMQDGRVYENTSLDQVIVDKRGNVRPYSNLKGNESYPLIIPKGAVV